MVLVLHPYPPSLEQLSLRSSLRTTSSIVRSTLSSRSTDTLEATRSPEWSLPLRQDIAASVPASTIHKDANGPTRDRSWSGHSHLEVNTSLRPTTEQSSMSPLSSSTLGSELCSSSDTEADEEPTRMYDVVPKLEDDEDGVIESIKRADSSDDLDSTADGFRRKDSILKKKRGRPKKPQPSQSATQVKVTKGRSKTGCLTCRRRKKKCDEAKPSCLNCQKNAVVCEGYTPRQVWRSGKDRTTEGVYRVQYNSTTADALTDVVRRVSFTVPRGLPFLVDGIETDVDRRFLDHFVYNLSHLFTLHDDSTNPFKDILLPMATQHKGLMHSLLALSGSHIVAEKPDPAYNDRQDYHFAEAISTLRANIEAANEGAKEPEGGLIVEDPTVASTIVHCLICISQGTTKGEHRDHMNGARELLKLDRKSKNREFQQFIWEFFMYHDVSNSLTSLDWRPVNYDDPSLPNFVFQATIQPQSGVVLGVIDGLYKYLKKITALRDNIRARKAADLQPVVLYEYLSEAVSIDAEIRGWESKQEPETSRWLAAELYRQCTWVYLYRTIQASKPNPNLSAAVDAGLDCLRAIPRGESTQCILLMPLFILGCAAFEERQRPDLELGFDNLQAYSNLGNIKPAKQIVRRVWEMMDAGDERSWDWETIMFDMGLDLLVT
ncbi:hypothetical protein MMC17_001145 [Xylographa soralifera]|nr:hypothetical protein [Xylographa soralifera]